MMKKLVLTLCVTSLLGCTAKPLNQGASTVRVMNATPENCEFLGEVDGSQGNWFTADLTSDRDIIIGARNEMKNQAHALGANIVVIKKSVDNSNAGISGYKSGSSAAISSTKGTYSSTLIGEAFRCGK
ncbi:DUF4156 domain-containing protein [Vibrio mediterranei]|uniref:DUF4156 domain-containing protein n=1 Tax=Vibrio mediterranei TaxID=689 RepID=A0AAN1FJ31_9VIBR|nr:DUF4156 domain-containing protein [Vibrio mediterranei]ASI91585.1 hypothetical protein BSZ05_17170 [Vibrio mediterranei]NOI26232.1 DUF4156 domain-containing protein [Vibrio mediterranei]